MQICICGWHYVPEFYKAMSAVQDRYNISIIAHRQGDTLGLPYVLRENTGLEWGAYSLFASYFWEEKSDVLFLHDDTYIRMDFFDELSTLPHDQAFIFHNDREFREAYSHGRAFFASARFLQALRVHGGLWYDSGNRGFISNGKSWSEKPPGGCLDHNAGIRKFTSQVKEIGKMYPQFAVNKPFFSRNIVLGKRGCLTEEL